MCFPNSFLKQSLRNARDQFAAAANYFSNCVLRDKEPEPDANYRPIGWGLLRSYGTAFLSFAVVLWMYILGAPVVGNLVQDLVQVVEKVHGG